MKMLVADISKYQGNIDFKKLATSGIGGVIIRAGYRGYLKAGTLQTDNKFIANIEGCIKNKIPYGVYFFSQATTIAEAKEEAEYTLNLIKKFDVKPLFPIYIDTEYSNKLKTGRADKISKAVRTSVVKAFCETIEKAGYYAGIYASSSWYSDMLNDNDLTQFTHWVADYRGYCGYKKSFDMWQYTSTGRLNGISSNVDLNNCYKDFPSIIKNVGLNGYKKEEVAEPVQYYNLAVPVDITESDYKLLLALADTLDISLISKEKKYYEVSTSEMTYGDVVKFENLLISKDIKFTIKEI